MGAFHPFSALKTELIALSAHSWAGGGERWEGAPLDSVIALSVFTFSACLCLSFQVITPFRRLILCAENRKEMEDWISSLKSVQSREHYEVRGIHLTNTQTRVCNDLYTRVCPWTGAEMKTGQRETGDFLRKCSSNSRSEIRSVLWLWDAAFRINILLLNKYFCRNFPRSLDIKVRSFKALTVTYKLYDHQCGDIIAKKAYKVVSFLTDYQLNNVSHYVQENRCYYLYTWTQLLVLKYNS